ncbi:MAG: type II toxin-antitoxin system HicA family toxin [Minisyncoccia bacterium]
MATSLTPALKKLLSAAGCYFERQGKGDHEIWYSPLTERRFVVDNTIAILGAMRYNRKQIDK